MPTQLHASHPISALGHRRALLTSPPRPCLATVPLTRVRRSLDTLLAARAEGRVSLGYEAGIRVGRAYQALPWLARVERALGFKPHTIGLWITESLLTAPAPPPAEAEDASAAAAADSVHAS